MPSLRTLTTPGSLELLQTKLISDLARVLSTFLSEIPTSLGGDSIYLQLAGKGRYVYSGRDMPGQLKQVRRQLDNARPQNCPVLDTGDLQNPVAQDESGSKKLRAAYANHGT